MTTEEITTNTVTKTNELPEQKGLDAPLVSGSGFSAFRSPKFNNNKMKREFNFYKSYYAGFRAKDLLPIFSFTKNVQGWTFTRVWSLNWFTYVASFSLIKRSDLNEDRGVAHEKNVKMYMVS